ncbi:MAG: sigma-E factor negative regulatory protein [Proteobacteria bacterium]|nr:sigma-E factor negative regulatory protein [Pseudomonadota bacterium]
MSKRKEKISAFLDDDMHRDELMSFSLSAEDSDAKVALRYQMVGDALRGEMSESSFVDVSCAVREALVDENIAEQMTTARPETSVSEKSGFFDLSAWFKPVAGMAVAASVAVVMVVTVTGQDDFSGSPVATNVETSPAVQPAVQLAAENKVIDNKATDLDPYINQHLEFATQDTLQGRLPYVRAVSFETKNNPVSEK